MSESSTTEVCRENGLELRSWNGGGGGYLFTLVIIVIYGSIYDMPPLLL